MFTVIVESNNTLEICYDGRDPFLTEFEQTAKDLRNKLASLHMQNPDNPKYSVYKLEKLA